ncbi:MAG: hypothetical protein DRP83_00600 [Planctomycetota bacterium]|nr:MAG: hypothetical protein DRP83_00600 [Planctomycetota bacterium]
MSKKKYNTAVVFGIQPEDDYYCGGCEWACNGECTLFQEDIYLETVYKVCECCGAEKSIGEEYCRCPGCIEGECLVREE